MSKLNQAEVHTKSGQSYIAGDHQKGMQIELFLRIILPAQAIAIIHNPEECKDEHAHQQNGR